ncbi:hypothetical protein BOX15_Mlig027567g1, partial [Macrostomum lignano]
SMKGGSSSVTVSNADLKNSLDCLQQEVRRVKFPGSIDYHGLAKGAHSDLVSVLRHLFCDFSPALTGHLNKLGYELAGKDERRFLETVYLVLRDQLSYRPAVTCAQFLSQSYPSRKAALVADVCRLGRELAARLRRPAVHRSVFDPQRLKRPATAAATAPSGEVEVIETAPSNSAAMSDRPRSATAAGPGAASQPPRAQVVREPRHPSSCGASPRAPAASHAAASATFPLAARYSVPVTTVLASEDEPPGLANRAVQTGPWAAEQRVAELASGLAQQVSDLAARLTLLEQRVARLDGVAPPLLQQQQQPVAASIHGQPPPPPPPAQAHWAPQTSASVTNGRLVQGRLQTSEESPQPQQPSAAFATADYRRRPPVSPSPPPMLRSRSRDASGSEEVAAAQAAEATAAAMQQDLLSQAKRIEQLIAGTQSLLGSAAAPALRASAE